MNHDQAEACERLHAAATVADGNIVVVAADVRHALDLLAHYDRQLAAATRELAEAKTHLISKHPLAAPSPGDVTVTSITVPPAAVAAPPAAGS